MNDTTYRNVTKQVSASQARGIKDVVAVRVKSKKGVPSEVVLVTKLRKRFRVPIIDIVSDWARRAHREASIDPMEDSNGG